jgi:hypothetical protein
MLHPATALRYINDEIGYGVFATAFIPRGTFIWVLDAWDRILSPAQVAALPPILQQQVEKYAYINAAGDSVLCWDFGRYMNHSCAPTSLGLGESVEIAIRDIQPGEELTCEYGTLNLIAPIACRCQQPSCRQYISAQDLDHLWQQWDQTVAQLIPKVRQIEQPLLPFIKASPRERAVLEGIFQEVAVPLPSLKECQTRNGMAAARRAVTVCEQGRMD